MATIGDKVRSRTSGTTGVVTEVIEIEHGHEIVAPIPGTEPAETGKYEPRTDLRVEYTDNAGNTSEVLMHDTDAEPA